MNEEKLIFKPIIDNISLVSKSIYDFVINYKKEDQNDFLVAEINPDYMDGNKLCEHYNINRKMAFNCLIVECKRKDITKYCALVVPTGYRYNMGSVIRKYTNSRIVSVAPLDYVLKKTKMEYGSISPIGLPKDWEIIVDSSIYNVKRIIVGGGLQKSKICIPTSLFLNLSNVTVLENVAKRS